MFRSKVRINTCKVILVTSLIWFVIDVLILAFYSDSVSNLQKLKNVSKRNFKFENISYDEEEFNDNQENEILPRKEEETKNEQLVISSTVSVTYAPKQLKRWRTVKSIVSHPDKPGEQGKGVLIPTELEAEMKEKFKLNQFNIMASDKIQLNRSLLDVRQEG